MIKADTQFAQGLLKDLEQGKMPTTKAGSQGLRPTLAMLAVGAMLSLANGPVEAQQSWLQKMADSVRDASNVKRAGERAEQDISRVGNSDKDRLLGDIERALRSLDNGHKQAQRARERNGIEFPSRGDTPDAAPATGGRPNSELFGPGF